MELPGQGPGRDPHSEQADGAHPLRQGEAGPFQDRAGEDGEASAAHLASVLAPPVFVDPPHRGAGAMRAPEAGPFARYDVAIGMESHGDTPGTLASEPGFYPPSRTLPKSIGLLGGDAGDLALLFAFGRLRWKRAVLR